MHGNLSFFFVCFVLTVVVVALHKIHLGLYHHYHGGHLTWIRNVWYGWYNNNNNNNNNNRRNNSNNNSSSKREIKTEVCRIVDHSHMIRYGKICSNKLKDTNLLFCHICSKASAISTLVISSASWNLRKPSPP